MKKELLEKAGGCILGLTNYLITGFMLNIIAWIAIYNNYKLLTLISVGTLISYTVSACLLEIRIPVKEIVELIDSLMNLF